MLRPNYSRHMSSPCEFKLKLCQERSALAGQRSPHSAALHMHRVIRSSKSKMKPIIILLHRPVLCPHRLLETLCCSRLSGCCRFACKARDRATKPRRLSPFTLPTVEDAAWSSRKKKEDNKTDFLRFSKRFETKLMCRDSEMFIIVFLNSACLFYYYHCLVCYNVSPG